jgi:hypothetical protein
MQKKGISTYENDVDSHILITTDGENKLAVLKFHPTVVVLLHIWPRESLSTLIADNLNLPKMHLVDMASEVVLVNRTRAPKPGTLHFPVDTLNNGERHLFIESG